MDKILGIDYGYKKIGLALGSGNIVQPFGVIENRPGHLLEEKAFAHIVDVVWNERINIIVIGLPLLNKRETEMSRVARDFGERLKELLPSNAEVSYVDESRSSNEAKKNAVKLGISKKRRRNEHALAACEIVKRFSQ